MPESLGPKEILEKSEALKPRVKLYNQAVARQEANRELWLKRLEEFGLTPDTLPQALYDVEIEVAQLTDAMVTRLQFIESALTSAGF